MGRRGQKSKRSKAVAAAPDFDVEAERCRSVLKELRGRNHNNINNNNSTPGGLREVERGDATGLAFLALQLEDKGVQTEGFEVYESESEASTAPASPAAAEGEGVEEALGVENLVAKQAEALHRAKQILMRDNQDLSDQVEALQMMITACEEQRLKLLEENSALAFENSVLSGSLSMARERTQQYERAQQETEMMLSPQSPLSPVALVQWFEDRRWNNDWTLEVTKNLFEKPFTLGEKVGELSSKLIRDYVRQDGDHEYTLAGTLYRHLFA